ncbi:ZPR1 zinc-finger domain-containing protein [Pisolithus croceorrhizus]|nr:ZPR1 zinc-finger domain-containing protein [Pisolithus croceorrhizus]
MVLHICSLTSAPAGEDSGYDTIIRRHWTRDRVEAIEVVVVSFWYEYCGAVNNEIQSASTLKDTGILYTLKVLHRADLDRQIIRLEACTVEVPDFELQLPPAQGQLTTVEGFLRDIAADLSSDQPQIIDAITETSGDEKKIEDEVDEVMQVTSATEKNNEDLVKKAITIKFDDPSGNSSVEFLQSISDPKWTFKMYARYAEQNRISRLLPPEEPPTEQGDTSEEKEEADGEGAEASMEVCLRCARQLVTHVKKVSIPYFKDTLIMSRDCEHCGYRDNEKGKRITLRMEDREDLSRDILKSETCGLTIPEIDRALQPGILGGRFPTVEGIPEQSYEELTIVDEDRRKSQDFQKQLEEITNAEKPFTLVLDDPLANSYLQNLYAPDPDPNMEIATYE